MWLVVLLSTLMGLVVGRGIVAGTSAHRRGLPDRWWPAECEECGSGLSVTMATCTVAGHRQRWVSVGVPIGNAAVFGVIAAAVGPSTVLPAYLFFGATMVTLTVTDIETKLIPNRMLLPATALATGLLLLGAFVDGTAGDAVRGVIGGLGYFGVMYALATLSRGALGYGDVKMAFIIGVFTGYLGLETTLVAFVAAFILAAVASGFLLVTRVLSRKDMIPFGPFMAAAGVLAVVFGSDVAAWYGL